VTLHEYLSQQRGLCRALAKKTGLAQSSISRLSNGLQKPSWEAMAAIDKATGGAVAPADWFPKRGRK